MAIRRSKPITKSDKEELQKLKEARDSGNLVQWREEQIEEIRKKYGYKGDNHV